VLRALDYFRAARRRDSRLDEALTLVKERRQPDGRWLLDVRRKNTLYEDLAGQVGEPNRWITERAQRVLDYFET
jgi:hypothetical protein